MATIRKSINSRRQHFTQVSNDCLRDPHITWEAKGVLAYMMSHDNGWEMKVSSLIAAGVAGRDKMYRILAELEDRGYLKREQEREEDGMFNKLSYVIQDTLPCTDEPFPENPDTDNKDSLRIPIKKNTSKKNTTPLIPPLLESVVGHWNKYDNLPSVRNLGAVKSAFNARQKDHNITDVGWYLLVDQIACSGFLTGDNDRGWKIPSFAWILQPKKFDNLLAGAYNNPKRPDDPQGISVHSFTGEVDL